MAYSAGYLGLYLVEFLHFPGLGWLGAGFLITFGFDFSFSLLHLLEVLLGVIFGLEAFLGHLVPGTVNHAHLMPRTGRKMSSTWVLWDRCFSIII